MDQSSAGPVRTSAVDVEPLKDITSPTHANLTQHVSRLNKNARLMAGVILCFRSRNYKELQMPGATGLKSSSVPLGSVIAVTQNVRFLTFLIAVDALVWTTEIPNSSA
jgi:hypothetical protein